MPSGTDLTFQILRVTKNQAANALLESAFHSSSEPIRKVAGITLINRKAGAGIETLIRDFEPDNQFIIDLINDNRQKIIPVLRSSIVSNDDRLAQQAFRLAYAQEFYEVLPTLFCFVLADQGSSGQRQQRDLLKFTDKYLEALERAEAHERHRLFHVIFPEILKTLKTKAKDFRFDSNELTLNTFLRLYPFFTDAESDLKQFLKLQTAPLYLAAYRLLLTENKPYLFRFVSRCFNRPNPPLLVLQVIAIRSDVTFLSYLFKSIKEPLPLEVQANLAKLPPVEWLVKVPEIFAQFDAEALQGLVTFLRNLPMPSDELEQHLIRIFYHGQGEGRLAAFNALKPLNGEKIDKIVWDAAGDNDPDVQIEAMNELSHRNLPGLGSRIIQFANTPNERVRETIQKLFPNFKIAWFMEMFDKLDDDRRRKIFEVVCSLDPKVVTSLSMMLEAGDDIAQNRALTCLEYNKELVPELESSLCWLLENGENAPARCKVAEALVSGQTEASRSALVQAFHRDTNEAVRTAAKTSLENRPRRYNM